MRAELLLSGWMIGEWIITNKTEKNNSGKYWGISSAAKSLCPTF